MHCVWDDWKIGDCSVTCGEGTRKDTRTQKVEADFGGDECDGSNATIGTCSKPNCPGIQNVFFHVMILMLLFA